MKPGSLPALITGGALIFMGSFTIQAPPIGYANPINQTAITMVGVQLAPGLGMIFIICGILIAAAAWFE